MSVQNILDRLEFVRQTNPSQWVCQCPCGHVKTAQMGIKELPDGRVLIHCFAGHSPDEILEAIDMSLGDLFEESIEDRIQPLYVVRKENKRLATIHDKIKSCQLRLDMAEEMRTRGMRLTDEDLTTERNAFVEMRNLQSGVAA
ncbi:MAG: hypothetical protein COB23_03080 [Methylophaga sp.]|nr:MAG: hypothetical protein COB23_03080 [Methylophaga sp.]